MLEKWIYIKEIERETALFFFAENPYIDLK